MKKTLIALALLLTPSIALATPVSWDYSAGTGILQPLQAMWSALVKAARFEATSTVASIFPYASTTGITASYASSTSYYGAGLGTCESGNMLTWSGGRFGCEADDSGEGGSSFAYPFPSNATTTVLTLSNGASIPKLTNLTSNGFVKTGSGDGTLSVDTNTYITGAAGADTELQFNNGGAFAGADILYTENGTNRILTAAAGTNMRLEAGSANSFRMQVDNTYIHVDTDSIEVNSPEFNVTAAGSVSLGAASTLTIPALTSALLVTNGSGVLAEYAGTSCTYAVQSLNALGTGTCGGFAYPFATQTYHGQTFQATSSNLIASSSIFVNATTTNATTTNLYVSGQTRLASLSGVLVAASGVVAAGVDGTNYTLIDANTCTNQLFSAVTAAGVFTCSSINNAFWSGADLSVANGGTGLSTFGGTNTILYTTAADTLASEAAFTYAPTTDLLTVVNASTTNLTVSTAFRPLTNDGAALGNVTFSFADLFLASGGVINWSNGNVTLTHSTDTLTLSSNDLFVATLASTTQFSAASQNFYINSSGRVQARDTTNSWNGALSPTRSFVLGTGTTTTWTASTTGSVYSPYLIMPFAGTLRQVRCATDASFLGVNTQVNGSNATPSYFVASTTVGTVNYTAGNTFSAGQKILVNFGTTTTATAASVTCTFGVTETF